MTVLFEYDSILFEYDSRRLATKAIDPPADWVSVVKRCQEIVVGDHVVKGHADISGQFAGREPPGLVFHLLVWPEGGEPFSVEDCHVINDYDGYGEDVRIYEFAARDIKPSVIVGARFNANGDGFPKVVTIPDAVCGHVDYLPTSWVVTRPPAYRVPEDFRDYSECNCDQALVYLAIIKALATTASGELRQLALATVERWERNYPGVDLTARLQTLQEDK